MTASALACTEKRPASPDASEGFEARTIENPAGAPAPAEESASADGMVFVPGGAFFMGCNEQVDRDCFPVEKPGRTIDLAPFWIDRTEVTIEDYRKCVNAGRCDNVGDGAFCNWGKAERDRHAINCVSWAQAVAYCEWQGKRLPTEAEWEKAARGTDGRKYPWGNAAYGFGERRLANICDVNCASSWKLRRYDDGYAETAPVGSYPAGASPFGALDMVGNVQEWTADWFRRNARDAGGVRGSPDGHPDDENRYRIVRGGSWGTPLRFARASYRNIARPDAQGSDIGFRCAR